MNEYGDISPRVGVKAAKKLLRVGLPQIVTQRFGMTDDQPRNSGLIRKWRRYHSFADATAPLAEGVSPAGQAIRYTDYTATLQQYGDKVPLTDIIADNHEDPVMDVMMMRCGEQFSQTIEALTLSVLKGGTNVYYAGGVGGRSSVNSTITRGDIRKVVRGFDRAYASVISRIIPPNPNVSTAGVLPSFFALAHTDLEPDIRNITGFKSIAEYSNPNQAVPGECGSVERVRFVLTPKLTSWETSGASGTVYLSGGVAVNSAASADVYPILFLARDAYGIVRLQGRQAVKVMVLNPNTPRHGDELGQQGAVSWKTQYACARLNEQWMARLEVGCTANPS